MTLKKGSDLMIDKFIDDVCEILKIDRPIVSFNTSNFQSKTMLAQCNSRGTTIYIKEMVKTSPDYFFAIAHELRHIWQIRTEHAIYFKNYKPLNLCKNLNEYNSQIEEIDANAFAGYIIREFFGLKPLFKSLPYPIRSNIFKRMKKIECN